ncbi:MAG: hypothetical protein RL094_590 [Candidatus Parcubacteria bacterium]
MITANKNIKTIIFDCFGVLIDPVLSLWYKDNYLNRGFVDSELQDILKRFDLGELSEDDIFDRFSKYEGITATKQEIRSQADSYLKLNNELIDLISKLRASGYQIVLLSNANHSFFDRKIFVDFPEFKNLFDHIIISSHIKMVKPESEIYLHTLQKINGEPSESIFIDDNVLNVEAAERLGIQGHVYTDVSSLTERLKDFGVNA